MKKFLYFVSFVMCLLFCSMSVSAEEISVSDLSIEDVSNYALNFADIMGESDLCVSDVFPIYGISGVQYGFCVDFSKQTVPYGYLILDFRLDDPVSEFCLQEYVLNPYSVMTGSISVLSNDKKAVFESVFQKGYLYQDDLFIDETGATYNVTDGVSVLSSEPGVDWGDLFQDDYDGSGNTVVTTNTIPVYDPNKSCIGEAECGLNTGRYACVPVAMTAAVNQNDILVNDDVWDTFLAMWDETSTSYIYDGIDIREKCVCDADGNEVCYKLGTTMDRGIYQAIARYLNDFDVSYSRGRIYGPTFEDMKMYIDDEPDIVLYSARVKNADGLTVGHCVNVLGYVDILYTNTNDTAQYLFAADGWNSGCARYLSLDSMVLTGVSPVFVWVDIAEDAA